MDTSPDVAARVVVVGEALVDVVRHEDGRSAEHPGGSPLNVAYGLGRLGHRVQFLGRIGDDGRGGRLRAHLAGARVDLFPGSLVHGPTSVAQAQVDDEGRATYEFEFDSTLPRVQLTAELDHVHTGSIGASVPPGSATALELLRSARAVASTSYDPNVRPVFFSGPEQAVSLVEEFVAASDVVKASDEDLRWLFPGEADVDVATRWSRSGPALVVVTRGGAGAVAVTGGGVVEVGAPTVAVVDTVGAGDAFTSGLLDALAHAGLLGVAARPRLRDLSGPLLRAVLEAAVHCASATCRRAGARPPDREELRRHLDAVGGYSTGLGGPPGSAGCVRPAAAG